MTKIEIKPKSLKNRYFYPLGPRILSDEVPETSLGPRIVPSVSFYGLVVFRAWLL